MGIPSIFLTINAHNSRFCVKFIVMLRVYWASLYSSIKLYGTGDTLWINVVEHYKQEQWKYVVISIIYT